MYNMFIQEWIPKSMPPSFVTYVDVFKSKNLSTHRPKKDQCFLCNCYREGSEETKKDLQEKYEADLK